MDELNLESLSALEHQGWDALCTSTGGTFYGALMLPDAVMVLVNGMVLDQPTIAQSLNSSPPWSTYSLTDARVIPTGGDSAILLYTATAQREGDPEPFVGLMSSHYRLVDGAPRLALYQQTTVTH